MEKGPRSDRRPLFFRVGRKIWRMGRALAGGEWVRLSADLSYSAGFLAEFLMRSGPPANPPRELRLETSFGDRTLVWRSIPVGVREE